MDRMSLSSISFTSKIRPVGFREFYNLTSPLGNKRFVDCPWTVKQSVISDSAYTVDVADCTVLGIKDKGKVLLMHLCPYFDINFAHIENFIQSNLQLKSPDLKALILGSKKAFPSSNALFDKMSKFLKDNKISHSEFRNGFGTTDVAYLGDKDEWLIGSSFVSKDMKFYYKNPRDVMEKLFEKVNISDTDELLW